MLGRKKIEWDTMDWDDENAIYEMKKKYGNYNVREMRTHIYSSFNTYDIYYKTPTYIHNKVQNVKSEIKFYHFLNKLFDINDDEININDVLIKNNVNLYIKIIEKDIFDKTTSENKYDKLLLYSANGNIKELKTLLKKYPKEPKKIKINDDILPFQWFECEKKN